MPMTTDREYRAMTLPMALAQAGRAKRFGTEHYVEGYATTFDKPYLLFEHEGVKVYEVISRSALSSADMRDVIMRYDHKGKVLARLSNGTLGLEADNNGLFAFADLSKSRAAQDLHEEIRNGLITQMSWGFKVEDDSYERDPENRMITRTIHKMRKVYDVSAVGIPANAETYISARSYLDGVIEVEKREALARQAKLILLKINLEV